MSDHGRSLVHIFNGFQSDLWDRGVAALESSPALGALAGSIAGRTELMTWGAALKEVVANVPALLEIDVVDVLVAAWKKGEDLRGYANPERYGPHETILVELTRHVVRSSHEPHVDVKIDDVTVGRVDFEFEMALTPEAAVLEIRAGKIHAVRTGSCQASGALSCEGISLFEGESLPFEIPGKVKLRKPIAIAPPEAAARSGASDG